MDVHGVGYEVTIPVSAYSSLPEKGAELRLHIHTHVREDALLLFGFVSAADKAVFEKLITVSGIGPTLAVKALGGLAAPELAAAIRSGAIEQLVRIPGVGKKTAERIVLELRDKLAAIDVPGSGRPATRSQLEADVSSALVNLGYEPRTVEKAVEKARTVHGAEFEALLKASLQILGASAMQKSAHATNSE